MRKAALAIALIAICAVFFLQSSDSRVVNNLSKGTDIIAFGDSLVEGVGSGAGGGFVTMLSSDLGVPIINLGVSGNTTEDALARVSEIENYKPKVVIVLLGGNDFLRKVPEETTFKNLESIVRQIQSLGSMVLILGVRSGALSNRFNGEFERLADKYEALYIPNVLDGIFGHTDLMHDSLHPNDKGYRMIAEKVRPVLKSLLK